MQSYAIIFALLISCDYIAEYCNLSIPGSILGLFILFLYFLKRGKVSEQIEHCSKTLLTFLPLFLVPVGVGIKSLLETADMTLLVMVAVSVFALLCAITITVYSTKMITLLVERQSGNEAQSTNSLVEKGDEKC